DVASLSKFITASALVRALKDLKTRIGIDLHRTLDSSIEPYLPSDWTRGSGISNVTFRNVMQHTSCLTPPGCLNPPGDGDLYAALKARIAAGVNSSTLDNNCSVVGSCTVGSTYQYDNAEYALLRVIIPYIVDGPQAYNGLGNTDYLTAMRYRQYVRG